MNKKFHFVMIILLAATTASYAKVTTVASSTDIAAIVHEIGGTDVEVSSIAKGKSNLHFVEMLPSYMLKVAKADIYFKIGLAMDQWAAGIIDGSRNSKLLIVDCSKGIEVLEKPTGKVDASMGDVHPDGNPHYWLDPRNGVIIARNVFDGLCQVDPSNAQRYRDNLNSFSKRIDSAWQVWSGRAAKFSGMAIISYHGTWAYFAKSFGVVIAGQIEPKPGIEPTASHTAELIEIMKTRHVKLVFREPYFSDRAPNALAKATGATVVSVPSSVGGSDRAANYFSLFDTLIDAIVQGAGKP